MMRARALFAFALLDTAGCKVSPNAATPPVASASASGSAAAGASTLALASSVPSAAAATSLASETPPPVFATPSSAERRALEDEALAVLRGDKPPAAVLAWPAEPRVRVTADLAVRAGVVPDTESSVTTLRNAARACYERVPRGSGEATLSLHADPPLETTLVGTAWSGTIAPVVRTCIEDHARKLSFGQGQASVVMSLTLDAPR